MIFKIAATVAILGWIIGNIGWHIVREPYGTGLDPAECFFGAIIVAATISGVAALVALIWGI